MKKLLGLFAVLMLTVSVTGHAQVSAGQGAVAGIVQDQTKAAIPGAHVSLDNPGIGFHKEVVTGSSGEFSFAPLTVIEGYNLTVTASGFSIGKVDNFATSVGTVVTQNVLLAVGSQGTTVEVQGGSIEQVQTDSTAVSQLIDKQVWQESPLSVRDSNQFVELAPGASPTAVSGRGFAINGTRAGTGNFMVEGVDNNDQGTGGSSSTNAAGAPGGSNATISPDAIQEYRIITSVPPAEYGRAAGFTTDTVLRSGTRTWHGSAFEYNRIQALAQNSWFSNHDGLRDHLVRNQFGGSIGGPVYKDRTFFFATGEFQRQRTGSPSQYTSITQDFYNFVKSGNYQKYMEGTAFQNKAFITDPNTGGQIDGQGFCPEELGTTCPGSFSDVATLGPTFNALYNSNPSIFPFATINPTPIPTDLLLGDTEYLPVNIYATGNVISSVVFNQNRGSFKLDHKLTEHDQLSFSYVADLQNTTYSVGGGEGFPGPPELAVGGAQLFSARWTHTFTPNLLNDFKAGYNRHVQNIGYGGPQGVASEYSADSISTGFGGAGGLPQLFTENAFSYEDSASYTRGRHTMKTGFRFIRTRNGSSFYNDVRGTIGFWGAPGVLTDGKNEIDGETVGAPAGYTQAGFGGLYAISASQDPSTGLAPDPYRGYRANEFSAYAQDDWKVTPRLLLSYGVRWDYFGPPHNFRAGIDSNVYFGTASTLTSSGNPFEPNVPLLIAEQGSAFKCVGSSPCGNAVLNPANPAGYAAASGMSTIWDRDLNNFAPRLGFSYDTFGNGKFVLRGGFGIGYDRLYNNVYENIRFNGPHFVDNTLGYGNGAAAVPFSITTAAVQPVFTANNLLSGANPVPRHVNQHLKTAYYESIHFGFETQARGYVLEVNYIGNLGRQLVGLENANTFEGRVACYSGSSAAQKAICKAAGYTTLPTTRPTTLFGNDNFRTNGFTSNYSGGQVSLRKGYSNGFQVSANYTYSKAMDEISDVFTQRTGSTGITTPYNPSNSYGPADFDTRHLATFTANYQTHSQRHKLLLAGWGISPILLMRSGAPIYTKDSNSSYDPNKDGTTGVEKVIYSGPGSVKNALNHKGSPNGIDGVPGSGPIASGLFKPYVCPTNVNGGVFCEVPGDRQSLYGLRQYNLDAQISKHIALTERFKLTLQAAFFDVDGHVEWGDPSGDINSTSFGKSTGAGGREGQLSARIDF